jgi:hypothetical protein
VNSLPVLANAWARQSVWSLVANRLKRDVRRARLTVLGLTIAGALLSTLAVVAGLERPGGKALAFTAAVAVGLAGIVRSRASAQAVRDWTRARSASEAIKSEVYLYLTRVGGYTSGDVERRLDEELAEVERDVEDLLPHAQGVQPERRSVPGVRDVDAYERDRVAGQIEGYYRKQAGRIGERLRRVRWSEVGLAVLGAVLAAAAGTWEVDDIAVWVPVVTTVAAAITAHAAAERYEFLLVEYLRTAAELERLVARRKRPGVIEDEEFVRRCEHVISVQNEGWMAKLTTEGQPPRA